MSDAQPPSPAGAWEALRNRKLVQWTLAYVAVAFALVQGIDLVAQQFGLGDAVRRAATILLATGLPITAVLAWFHGERGAQRVSGLELVLLSILVLAGAALAWRFAPGTRLDADASRALDTDPRPAATTPAEATAAPVPDARSIAVLPFADMSQAQDQEYFSDGISEELLNLLAKIPQLRVTARTSSFSFKGSNVAIPEIARTLKVAHVLEGSVRKSGNSVRITAQLIRAGTDTHLWSQTYDRKLDDIFAIQDEIAADVVKQLKVTLLGAAPKARTTDPEVYALYLQAVQLGRRRTAEAYKRSDALLLNVLAIDPGYAPAWAASADNFAYEANLGLRPSKEGFGQALEAARKAITIDPQFAPAHAHLGYLAMSDNDLVGAARHLKHALMLDPADPDVLRRSAALLLSLGRLDEALVLDEAIVRLDPVNASAIYNLGYDQRMAGRFDAAITSHRTALSLAPDRGGGSHFQLGCALLMKGDAIGALAEIELEKSSWKRIGLPMVYGALGRKSETIAALDELIAEDASSYGYNIAHVYAFLGDADKAFEWLDKAVEYGDPGLAEITVENLFDKIHDDPRWLPFLRRIGKAPEQLATIEFKVTLPGTGTQ